MTRTRPPQPQVSVIVPVYNQEQYLEECITAIRRQTLAEWECIIVNDGSSDSSGEIARRFSEEDSRIRCFEQENRGVSSARNLGMRHASGRYLCFVDGDDFIDAAFLKHLLDASDRGASDLTVSGKAVLRQVSAGQNPRPAHLRHISAPGVPLEKQSGIPGRHSPL